MAFFPGIVYDKGGDKHGAWVSMLLAAVGLGSPPQHAHTHYTHGRNATQSGAIGTPRLTTSRARRWWLPADVGHGREAAAAAAHALVVDGDGTMPFTVFSLHFSALHCPFIAFHCAFTVLSRCFHDFQLALGNVMVGFGSSFSTVAVTKPRPARRRLLRPAARTAPQPLVPPFPAPGPRGGGRVSFSGSFSGLASGIGPRGAALADSGNARRLVPFAGDTTVLVWSVCSGDVRDRQELPTPARADRRTRQVHHRALRQDEPPAPLPYRIRGLEHTHNVSS